jgi:Na+-driven multidrug efflux pump
MELYMFFAFLLFYIITVVMLDDTSRKRIWMIAFILSFVATSVAIGFIKGGKQDVMMNVEELNWYYFLYLFGMISVVMGLFNLWIYRKELWQMMSEDSSD